MTDPRPYHILRFASTFHLSDYPHSSLTTTQLRHPPGDTVLPGKSHPNSKKANSSIQRHHQSFVGGTVAFRALPRPQFASLQAAIFPIYFSMQTALPVVVALTASRGGQTVGLSGLTAPEHRFSTLLPLATVAVTGLINLFVLRPMTINVMRERKAQGEFFFFVPYF